MADLQDTPACVGKLDQLPRLGRRLGDWLFHQHMGARLQEVARDGEVRWCRRHHAYRIDRSQQLVIVGNCSCAQLRRDLLAGRLPGIDDGDELAVLGLRILLRVKTAEIADSDDRCSDFLHGGVYYRRNSPVHWPTRLHLATPPPRSLPLLDLLARARRSTESRLSRELILLGLLLITGLVLVPLAIWVVGNRALGSYTHGSNPNAGPLALLGDFYAGLTSGAPSYWVVALGPLLIV